MFRSTIKTILKLEKIAEMCGILRIFEADSQHFNLVTQVHSNSDIMNDNDIKLLFKNISYLLRYFVRWV